MTNSQPEVAEVDMMDPARRAILNALAKAQIDRTALPLYRNIGGRKMPLNCGRFFQPGEVLGLTDDEVARFNQAGLVEHRRLIVAITGGSK